MEDFKQVTLKHNTLSNDFTESQSFPLDLGLENDSHPGTLQVVLQRLADHTSVLHSDRWTREILVPHFSLN